MESTQLILNEQLVTISAERHTIRRLNEDDRFLADYVNRAAKAGQFHFLFDKDPTLRRIVVKRVPAPAPALPAAHCAAVWTRRARSKDADVAAVAHLLRLRNSLKYASRFREGQGGVGVAAMALWEELAADMRLAGFDVDGPKCANKFAQITQNFLRKDFTCLGGNDLNTEIKKILDEPKEESEDEYEDEEWLPKNKRGKKRSDDSEDFFRKILKRKEDLRDERFKELCSLMKRRNELNEEKLRQNREIINILGKLAK